MAFKDSMEIDRQSIVNMCTDVMGMPNFIILPSNLLNLAATPISFSEDIRVVFACACDAFHAPMPFSISRNAKCAPFASAISHLLDMTVFRYLVICYTGAARGHRVVADIPVVELHSDGVSSMQYWSTLLG